MTSPPRQGRLRSLFAHHGRLLFLAGLALAYWIALAGFALPDGERTGRILVRLAGSIVELWFTGLLLAGCMRMAARGRARPAWLALCWAISGLACAGYLVQAYSLHISGNFLTALALQNGDSAQFLLSKRLMLAAALALLWWLAFCWSTLLPRPAHGARPLNGEWLRRGAYAGSLGVAMLLVAYLATLQRKAPALEPGFRQAPLAALAIAGYDASRAVPDAPSGAVAVDVGACFPWPARHEDFPFQKNEIYRERLARAPDAPPGRPNMIVLMSEGVSARMLGAYGGEYPGLTPNFDRVAAESMRVDNYFNHTAATYRGVGGQMASGFMASGGAGQNGWERVPDPNALTTTRRQTVPALLSAAGWQTYFLAPHPETKPFIVMLRSIGFSQVYSRHTIGSDLLGRELPLRGRTAAIEDQSLFEGLQALLERRLSNGEDAPFFIMLYNIGTHAMIPPGPVRYPGHDNPVLDKLHNYDAAFGQFLDWFDRSPYARNTILVVTADHSTYPEPAYRKVAGSDFRPFFVDRIPLLVRDPFHRLPATLDADGRNSLDLAPTLLQLLEAPQAPNSFLGRSLFEPRSMPLGIAWTAPGRYFLTTREGVRSHGQIPPELASQFGCHQEVLRRYLQAEADDRIFAPDLATDTATGQR
ncbi:LTA synthase family protein [Luteimonas wenzhouensis]|jgi:lipoteichoic acid synthase|uniref:LTA synthase family protein n=1 Tax=Luteimonas wenzhouensis TaxID=2599615 RepID=A0A5C5U7J8_9GAMM|nr:LTA synthase family protein [Luteimonas wenzhouensis]NLW95797.1 LTA synthase family protein [Xanthomonadaceae bacterium]TWT22074.1 LTA synthase family protein [Luteimonas wenzhouensis]